MAVGTRMQQRRATAAVWNLSDYILAAGELGVTTDTGIIKVGNGVSTWSALDPAFDSQYLPILGQAADSALLEGISASGFLKPADATTAATADKLAMRTSDGRVKGATASANDDLTTLLQQTSAISAAVSAASATDIVTARQETIVRTVTGNTTAALTDVSQMIFVNHASTTAQVTVTVPTNATAAFPLGSWFDVCAIGLGGAKLIPAGGVTLRGKVNVMPSYGVIRMLKIATNEWLGIEISNNARFPKIRVIRTGTTSYGTGGVYVFVPYDTTDSAHTYNPDNDWFSIPGTGLPTARRVIVNKDGEYLVNVDFNSSNTTNTFTRIVIMTADNSSAGSTILNTGLGNGGVTSMSTIVRLTAGQSLGASHNPVVSGGDLADGTNTLRNGMIITRIGD